ncbi:LADA_0H12200g1_1 [Lachancea dasiensis]|uniref:LADA_0H12200g1_1 n=1 Tax=Lachancea dasiensis TaxID=1072105 RepID=A0A1G4K3P2_9SACH|nr:LADA_0H12200g1_1 [Lachancea dasiensis]
MKLYLAYVLPLAPQALCVAVSLVDTAPVQATGFSSDAAPTTVAWITLRTTIIRSRTVSPGYAWGGSSTETVKKISSAVISSLGSSTKSILPAGMSVTLSQTSSSDFPDAQFLPQVLNQHNAYRKLHSAPALIWSAKLQNIAQDYANNYNCNGTLIHSNSPFGENLALGFNSTGAVSAWYNEYKLYDYEKPGFSEKTGHFTQLVWEATTEIGCAYIDCGDYYGQYTICNYNPPGNVAGQYQDNVKKR